MARRYCAIKYSPQVAQNVINRADQGYFGDALDMYDAFATTDPETIAAVEKRQNGVRNAKRTITPADESPTAAVIAEYVETVLKNLIGWDSAVLDLEAGNYNGFVALEIEWTKSIPIALHPTLNEDWRWQNGSRVLADSYAEYVGLLWRDRHGFWQPTPMDKFVINTPNARLPVERRGCMRATAGPWTTKQILQVVLDTYIELYGVPRTIIGVPDDWSNDDPRMLQLVENMSTMGTEGYSLLSKEIDIMSQGHQSSEHVPHLPALERKDRQISKAINGTTITTDTTGATGTFAASAVQVETEYNMAERDLENITTALNRDLIRPIVYYGFGSDELCPALTLSVRNPLREKIELDLLDIATNKLGLRISTDHAYERTGYPEPEKGQEVLPGDIKYRTETVETGDEGESNE